MLAWSSGVNLTTLQGKTAKQILSNLNKDQIEIIPDAIGLFVDGQLYWGPKAILKSLNYMGIIFQPLRLFYIFPEKWQWVFYRWLAKNRYRLFGKKETCRIPKDSEKDRLLP